MAISTSPSEAAPVAVAATTSEPAAYVDWAAVFAGAVLAAAISFVLFIFGSALGLSFADFDENRGMSVGWFAITAALWAAWVQISSYFAGGYLAGRLRRRVNDATEDESDVRDGSHGLLVWAVGVLFTGLIAFAGLTGAAATTAVSASTVAAGAAANEEVDDAYALVIDRYLRGSGTADRPLPSGMREEIGRVVTSSLDAGTLSEADRAYLVSTIQAGAGLDEAAAQQRVEALWADAQAARQQALDAAERARQLALIGAFLTAATLFLAAAAAYYAGTLGGNHRDRHTAVVGWYRPWQ
jgi:hypothetical protein